MLPERDGCGWFEKKQAVHVGAGSERYSEGARTHRARRKMTERMRFCMVTTFYPPFHFGGDALFVYRLSNALAELGHEIDVVHCEDAYRMLGGNGTDGGTTGSFVNHPNIKVHRLASGHPVISSLLTQQTGAPYFARQLKQLITERRPDVIHYHNMS